MLSDPELEIEMSSVAELESDELLSVPELFEEFRESSFPPLHEMIVRLIKKMIKMNKIFFTFSSNICQRSSGIDLIESFLMNKRISVL